LPGREACADLQSAQGARRPPPTTLVSTVKARQAGFSDCMDTEDMFRKWFRRFQERRWLPAADPGEFAKC
jgi:hypothetical protein